MSITGTALLPDKEYRIRTLILATRSRIPANDVADFDAAIQKAVNDPYRMTDIEHAIIDICRTK